MLTVQLTLDEIYRTLERIEELCKAEKRPDIGEEIIEEVHGELERLLENIENELTILEEEIQ